MTPRGSAWLVVGGQAVATVGDAMLLVLVPLVVLDRTGSPLQVALVFVLTQLPTFLGGLAGTPRRRFSPRALLIAYDVVRAVAVLGMAALAGGHLWAVFALVFGTNVATTLFRPTRIELVTHLAPEGTLRRFNSYDRTFEALAMAGGAALGGYAYAWLPLPAAFAVAGLTFAASALAMLPVRLPAAAPGQPAVPPVTTSFRAVAGAVARRRVPAYLLGGETLTGVAFGVFLAVFVIYSRQDLGVSGVTFGHFEMLQALAATGAGVLLGSGRLRLTDRRLAVLGYLGMGLSFLLLGLNGLVWVVFPLMVSLGVANMLYAVAVRTLLQDSCGPQEVVHVFALESILSRSALIAGAAAAGVLLDLASVPAGAALSAAGLLVLGVAVWGHSVLSAPEVPAPGTEVRAAHG